MCIHLSNQKKSKYHDDSNGRLFKQERYTRYHGTQDLKRILPFVRRGLVYSLTHQFLCNPALYQQSDTTDISM